MGYALVELWKPWFTAAFAALGIGNQARLAAQNRLRAAFLADFVKLYVDYVKSRDNKLVPKIAEGQIEVQKCLDALDIGVVVIYPPPIIAGSRPPLSMSLGLEALNHDSWMAGIAESLQVACFQGIGEYERRARKALWGILNPLVWLKHLVVEPLIAGPFLLVEKSGFSRQKAESSVTGRVVRLILGLAGTVISLVPLGKTLEDIGVLPTGSIASAIRTVVNMLSRK